MNAFVYVKTTSRKIHKNNESGYCTETVISCKGNNDSCFLLQSEAVIVSQVLPR